MVANAGIFSYKSILELSVEEYDNVMAVNARSVMLAIKHAGRQMVKQGQGGRIIGMPPGHSMSTLHPSV